MDIFDITLRDRQDEKHRTSIGSVEKIVGVQLGINRGQTL